jgi:hypothetical protein
MPKQTVEKKERNINKRPNQSYSSSRSSSSSSSSSRSQEVEVRKKDNEDTKPTESDKPNSLSNIDISEITLALKEIRPISIKLIKAIINADVDSIDTDNDSFFLKYSDTSFKRFVTYNKAHTAFKNWSDVEKKPVTRSISKKKKNGRKDKKGK